MPANGFEVSTLTITVNDDMGVPITDLDETNFDFSGNGNAMLWNFDATDAAIGVYTFWVMNSIPETVTITVSVDGVEIGETESITFTPVPSFLHSSLKANPTRVRADGIQASTLTIIVKDGNGAPFTDLLGAGVYTFQLTNTTPETLYIMVTIDSISISASEPIIFRAPVAADQSGVFADPTTLRANGVDSSVGANPPEVRADGQEASILTVTVVDVLDNPITDLGEDAFIFTDTSNATIDGLSDADALAGIYTFRVTNLVPETVNITVFAVGVELGERDAIMFNPVPHAANSSVVAAPLSIRADGLDASTLTIEVTVDGVVLGVPGPITFLPSIPDVMMSSVVADPTEGLVADGNELSVVTVTLRDSLGNPIPGVLAGDFTIDVGSDAVASPIVPVEGSPGTYRFSVTSTVPGRVTVRVTVKGLLLKDQPVITFVAEWPTLQVSKEADRTSVSVGATVAYRVEVMNQAIEDEPTPSFETTIVDRLPVGFVYQPGTTLVNGEPMPDPHIAGRTLTWQIGQIDPGQRVVLQYAVAVGLDAVGSDGINVLYVHGLNLRDQSFQTDPVSAQVVVEDSLFGHEGTVVGVVFWDRNGDGRRSADEPGIAGAMVYIDDGRRVIADEEGLYSIRHMEPGIRSLRVVVPTAEGVVHESHFVFVPVGGLALHNFPLKAESDPRTDVWSGSEDGLPDELRVGILDLVIQSGPRYTLRHGSIFVHRRYDESWALTFRYGTAPRSEEAGQAGLFPMPQPLVDTSRTESIPADAGDLYLHLETPVGSLTYGAYAPPHIHTNSLFGRLQSVRGALIELGVSDGATQLLLYGGSLRGTQHTETIEYRGTTVPYHLTHTPVQVGNVEVWFVRPGTGVGTKEERIRLKRGVDYVVDSDGSLRLLVPLTSGSAELEVPLLEVSYRSLAVDIESHLLGGRFALQTSTGQIGLSLLDQTSGGRVQRFVGLDGWTRLGTLGHLAWEAAISSNPLSGGDNGLAVAIESEIQLSETLQLELDWSLSGGAFVQVNGEALPDEMEATAAAILQLASDQQLTFERSFKQATGGESHRDALRLEGSIAPNIQYRLAWSSEGPSLTLLGDRASLAAAILSWSGGDQLPLSISTGLEIGSATGWKLNAPLQATYRLQLGDGRVGAFGVQSSLGAGAGGTSLIAAIEADGGSMAYTKYDLVTDALPRITLGGSHAWDVLGLRIRLTVEGRTEAGKLPSAAITWGIDYVANEMFDLALELEHLGQGEEVSRVIRAALVGKLMELATAYSLQATWYGGSGTPDRDGRTLTGEWQLALDHRSPDHQYVVLGQYTARTYLHAHEGTGRHLSRVGVGAIDAAYRFDSGVGVSARYGWKRELSEWLALDGATTLLRTDISLAQLGIEVPLSERLAVEMFGRALWDSVGGRVAGGAGELVYYLTEDIGVSVGFSTLGIHDPDLQSVAPWPDGVYYRLRVKF